MYLQYLMLFIVPHIFWLLVIESIKLCTPLDSAEHQLLWYCIPWECNYSYVPVLQISLCIHISIKATIMYYHLYICIDRLPLFEPWSPFLYETLLWAWVCPHCPYTCLKLYVPHPFFRRNTNQKPLQFERGDSTHERSSLVSPILSPFLTWSYGVYHPYDELLPS